MTAPTRRALDTTPPDPEMQRRFERGSVALRVSSLDERQQSHLDRLLTNQKPGEPCALRDGTMCRARGYSCEFRDKTMTPHEYITCASREGAEQAITAYRRNLRGRQAFAPHHEYRQGSAVDVPGTSS